MNEPVHQPTPEEATAALRRVHEGRERAITSALGSHRLWLVCGLVVFLYCVVNDLFPATDGWLNLAVLAFVLVVVFGLFSRVGSSLLGMPVKVSSRSVPLTGRWYLLSVAPALGLGITALLIRLLNVPHGEIWYGALAGIFVSFLGPRFRLWLVHRQDND